LNAVFGKRPEIFRFAQHDSAIDNMSYNTTKWLCCQLGAREHYAIPRALFRLSVLDRLVTDAWVPPSSFLAKLSGSRLTDRFHDELRDAPVSAFNSSLIVFELVARARRLDEWGRIIARNRWFQQNVCSFLRSQPSTLNYQPILLSYSYTALEPFRHAKSRGWKTVLVQIDPGPEEEKIVAAEAARVPGLADYWRPAPADYWVSWRKECDLADRIVVNSKWSQEGLIRSGVPTEKLSVIPLAYEPPGRAGQKSADFVEAPAARDLGVARLYPGRFTNERPLRVLFLGQVNLRKGIARLLDAARILRDEPVEFRIVGPVQITRATTIGRDARVKWCGPVTRSQVAEKFRAADVFLLPTLSDGFAITQLEAQAHRLPIIASRSCGKVVENGRTGIILEEPSAACIAAAIRGCIADPSQLQKLATASHVANEFTIDALAQRLQELGATL
jgi:glycosyltransferase involved in cell wall biosynthesis